MPITVDEVLAIAKLAAFITQLATWPEDGG